MRPTSIIPGAGCDHYFHTDCPYVRTYLRPETSKSSDNHCRPGLWGGRVDHWWLLSCNVLRLRKKKKDCEKRVRNLLITRVSKNGNK